MQSIEQVRFCSSGTEATMNAIRAAMAIAENETVLKVEGSYHGTHDTVEVTVSGDGREHVGIPANVEDRVKTVTFNDPKALKQAFAQYRDQLACFIVEPIMGAAGAIPATREYLETARDLTAGLVPLIFDKVMTLRFVIGGTQERYNVTPTSLRWGNSSVVDYQLVRSVERADLMSVFHPTEGIVHHSGAFNASPATMAAGTATLDVLDESAIERLNDFGDRLRTRLRETGR